MSKIDRYKALIRYIVNLGIAESQAEIGQKVGYNNPSAFSQVINGKTKEPKQFMQRFLQLVPELNINWLSTGEGDMLRSAPVNSIVTGDISGNGNNVVAGNENSIGQASKPEKYVPLLPITAQGGTLNDFVASIKPDECEKIISPIKGVDFAMTISGDSMEPEYPSGAKILIKRINEKAFIEWGRVYVLDTCNGSVIKRVMPSDTDTAVMCESINEKYPPFLVDFADIHGMYRVLMLLSEK